MSARIIAVVVMSVLGLAAKAEPRIPTVKFEDFTLETRAWVAGTYTTNPGSDDLRLSLARVQLTLTSPDKWQVFMSANFADYGDHMANWLEQIEFIYPMSENWRVHVGRLFLAPGFMTPPAQFLETINYPREPWGYYGWGVQVDGKFGDGYMLVANITGSSRNNFREDGNWDGCEFSAYLSKKVTKEFSLTSTFQVSSSGFSGVAIGFEYGPREDLFFRSELYKAWGDDRDTWGTWLMAAYKPAKWCELHSQIDYRNSDLAGQGVIFTNGVRFLVPKNPGRSVTIDYQLDSQGDADGLYARFQVGL